MKRLMLATFAGLICGAQGVSAGPFDCSLVYDEFDSFMNRQFLVQPEGYVSSLQNTITQDQARKQGSALLLGTGRKGMGVAVVQTNKNAHGKLLFSWEGRGDLRGTPLLILRDVTLYNDVDKGTGRKNFREVRVSATQMIDLDSGRATQGADADLRYQTVDAKTIRIEAINGAKLTFPMESLCK